LTKVSIGELRPAQPVEISRTIPSHGTLAVVRETLKSELPVGSSAATAAIAAETGATTPSPRREVATASGSKAVAPGARLTVERPVIAPTLASSGYVRIGAQRATASKHAGEMVAAYAGVPKVTRPGYVAPQASVGVGTPVKLASRTSSAATLARADLEVAGQHTSLPQLVQPLPTTAPRAADFDATIPTLRFVTKVMPGGTMVAALPQRTSTPQRISTAAVAPPPQPATAKVTEPPVLASGKRTTVGSIPSRVAMLPKAEVPSLADSGSTTRPAIPELARVIAESPVKNIAVVFDGEMLDLRAAPETFNGIATGPLRELFEHTDGVLYWFPITKEVRAINAETDLHLTIGNPDIDVNGATQQVSVAPYIKQGRTMLPLQFIADRLGVTISYEPTTQQIIVSSNEF